MSSITRFLDCIYFAEGRLFGTTGETLYKLIDFGKNSKFPERYVGIILPNPTKDEAKELLYKRTIKMKLKNKAVNDKVNFGKILKREVNKIRDEKPELFI